MSNIHLIGIGGAGLSAIATVLLQQGYTISGSDMQASATTERLTKLGATVFIGHSVENLADDLDVVIVSSAIPRHNPELVAAQQRGLKVVKRAEWLGQMMQDKVGIAIAGTHGKTTTTGMTAFLFQETGQNPTFIVGGFVPQLDANAAAGQGDAFIVEADEYDHTFLGLRPTVAVVTSVEWDHPDIFPTRQSLTQAFIDFVRLVASSGLVIGCGDDVGARNVIQEATATVTTYGLQAGNDWQAVNIQPNQQGGYDFQVRYQESGHSPLATVSLAVPGLHNVYNALAVLVMANHQRIDLAEAADVVGRFTGVGRRFELKGEVNGMTVFDDYAHHPTEIKATLAAARARLGERPIWAVFQPHTFSRTIALLDDFAGAFDDADHVVVVDIFAAREKDEGLISSQDIVNRMGHPSAHYLGSFGQVVDFLVERLAPPAVLLTLGAGDGYQIGEWVLERLSVER
jgi:UDP-N-acetylmuramate--alanine ligase